MYYKRLAQIEGLKTKSGTEKIQLKEALGRTLREDIRARISMPPFNKSAMDGYACRMSDLGNELTLLETIPAGNVPRYEIGLNECSKIMTGAAVPQNADCVFKIEDSEVTGQGKIRCTDLNTKRNIAYKGEDFKKGDILLEKGQILGPEHLAVIASTGSSEVHVSKKLKVSLLITGSELIEPGGEMQDGKIWNSNGSQIASLLSKMGIAVNYLGIVKDDYDTLRNALQRAVDNSDVLILTGGASVGDFDFVPDLLEKEGFNIYWERTGLKPGNPMTLGQKENKYLIGLSGNPVSSLVQFEFLAKPVLYRLMGANYTPFRFKGELAEDISRSNDDRLAIVPVRINNSGKFEKIPFNGSAHINGLAHGTALLEIPVGIKKLQKGVKTYVRPL